MEDGYKRYKNCMNSNTLHYVEKIRLSKRICYPRSAPDVYHLGDSITDNFGSSNPCRPSKSNLSMAINWDDPKLSRQKMCTDINIFTEILCKNNEKINPTRIHEIDYEEIRW